MHIGCMIDEDAIRFRWETVGCKLDERGRVFAAAEVKSAGRGCRRGGSGPSPAALRQDRPPRFVDHRADETGDPCDNRQTADAR